MSDRLTALKKTLKALPKDKQQVANGGMSLFTDEEWTLIAETYDAGTSLKTIYGALPEPKNRSFNAFRESYRKWRRRQHELATQQ